MYDYLDRPLDDLAPVDRLLLDGVRCWALARTLGGDPAAALARRLPLLADTGALAPLDRLMAALDSEGQGDALEIQRPCFATVEEAEAVLLAVSVLAGGGDLPGAEAALAHLVRPSAAARVAGGLAEVRRRAAPALARAAQP